MMFSFCLPSACCSLERVRTKLGTVNAFNIVILYIRNRHIYRQVDLIITYLRYSVTVSNIHDYNNIPSLTILFTVSLVSTLNLIISNNNNKTTRRKLFVNSLHVSLKGRHLWQLLRKYWQSNSKETDGKCISTHGFWLFEMSL